MKMIAKLLLISIYLLSNKITVDKAIIVIAHNETKNRVLELVQVLFRDGERMPRVSETYPNDPYGPYYYTFTNYTPGKLTDLGRFRARRLGQVLHEKYNDFLGENFKNSDVYAFTADQSSCRETMGLVLENLFDKHFRDNTLEVRVRSVPKEVDVLMNSKTCSRYVTEIERVRKSIGVQKTLSKYDGLYRYIQDNTGTIFSGLNKDVSIYSLYKLFEAQKIMNLTLPDWCTEGVLNLLYEITFLHYNLESFTETLRRLNGGPLVLRFLENLKTGDSKIQLYAGEDHNLAAFTRAMNKRFPRVPKYGSAIIVEKWREISEINTIYVRIIVWTGVTEKMFPLLLKDCTEMCPLNDFIKIIKSALPFDDEIACLLNVKTN